MTSTTLFEKSEKWLRRGLFVAALLLMIFHFAVYSVYAVNLAGFPFDYDQGEGFELNDTVLLSQFKSPYTSNEVFPFYASNYPPLYHVFLVPFVWLFGPAYWYGRLFGFLATLITALAIGYIVQRETKQRGIALLAGLAYLASNYIYHVGPLFRQHISMVMFETLAIVFLAIATDQAALRRRPLLIGLFFLLCAGFTKQLAIATVGGFFLFLFLRMPRRAVITGIGFGIVAGAIFLLLNVITGGQWWLNIITANVNGYIPGQFYGLLGQFIGLHGALFILAILYALYELYLSRLSAYTVWFVASAGSAILSGKWGAGDSYFATMIAAMCVLAGLFVARAMRGEWPHTQSYLTNILGKFKAAKPALTPIGILLFILYGIAVFKMPLDKPGFKIIADVLNLKSNTEYANFYDSAKWTVGYAKLGQIPTAQDEANGWKIVEYAKREPEKPILSEEAAFSFNSKKVVVSNPTQLKNLDENGALDSSRLIEMLNQKAFSVIIFRARFYPQSVLLAAVANYEVVEKIPMNGYEYEILLPKR